MVPNILAIAGGSGAGKTTLARHILQALPKDSCIILSQDNYYKDHSHDFIEDGGAVNFDHPDALDFDLMAEHLRQLKLQQKVEIPLYDFAQHKRLKRTHPLEPHPLIIVEGILILNSPVLRAQFDYSVFIEINEETRFKRRLERDIRERGRSPEGVKRQFMLQVKPMHDQFVEPSKEFANCVLHSAKEIEIFAEKQLAWLEHSNLFGSLSIPC